MIRHAAAVAVVMLLSPAWLMAQSTTLTITTASANVHKAPSIGSPVIGQAARGTVLPVTRDLGSWVKVLWPAAEDSVGYVHVSWGSIEPRTISIGYARPPATRPIRECRSRRCGNDW